MIDFERREASMKRTAILLPLTLALGMALGMVGNGLLSAQPQAIKRTPLQKLDLIGTEGIEHVDIGTRPRDGFWKALSGPTALNVR
jgi:hypothetical protein